jgi:hypothetical protein
MGGKMNILNIYKKLDFLQPTDLKIPRQINGNKINNYDFFKFRNFCRGGHCDYSLRA